MQELREGKWESELEMHLRRAGKTTQDVAESSQVRAMEGHDRTRTERTTTATNPWIAKQLAMVHPSRIPSFQKDI